MSIGNRIRTARTNAGLSQDQLGTAVGLTGKTIRRYEKGSTTPDSKAVGLIADITGHPVGFFLPDAVAAADETPRPAASDDAATTPTLDGPSPEKAPVRARYHTDVVATDAQPVGVMSIDGPRLVETGDVGGVPPHLLRRVSVTAEEVRLLPIPTRHYALRRFLHPSTTLVLRPASPPHPVETVVGDGSFVDGQYVVGIGRAGLQVKTLAAQPDGALVVAEVDGSNRFRYTVDELDGVTLHAHVILSF